MAFNSSAPSRLLTSTGMVLWLLAAKSATITTTVIRLFITLCYSSSVSVRCTAIAVSSRFRLAGDIYHERVARLELQAYAWYRNSALDFFYLFPQKTMLVSIRIQGVSHY